MYELKHLRVRNIAQSVCIFVPFQQHFSLGIATNDTNSQNHQHRVLPHFFGLAMTQMRLQFLDYYLIASEARF